MSIIDERLTFKPVDNTPKKVGDHDQEYLILNKCDGFHLVYANFDPDTGEFEGFSDFMREQFYGADFYVTWAKLPEAIPLIDTYQQ